MSKVVAELQNLGVILAPLAEIIAKLPDMFMAKNLKLSELGDTESESLGEQEMVASLVSFSESMTKLREQMLTNLLLDNLSSEEITAQVVPELQNLGKMFAPMSDIIVKIPGMLAAKNVKLMSLGEVDAETEEERERVAALVSLNNSMTALHNQMLASLAAERLLPLKHRETPASKGTVDRQPVTTTVVAKTTTSVVPAGEIVQDDTEGEFNATNREAIKGETSAQPGTTGADDSAADITVN